MRQNQVIIKGQRGSDWVQRVFAGTGVKSGSILWEFQRAKNCGGDCSDKVRGSCEVTKAPKIWHATETFMEFPSCLSRCPMTPDRANTFLGYPITQTWTDLALWEFFLNNYSPKSIVELGTWHGGMSLFLAMQCDFRGAKLVTVDVHQKRVQPRIHLERLGVNLLALDLQHSDTPLKLRSLLNDLPKPTLLFYDNGNKPYEWRTFTPLLQTSDFVAVHDWGTEITESDLYPRLPFLIKEPCEQAQSLTRFFSVS